MAKLAVESDGIVFGYTKASGRSYKSMNYHRVRIKPGKTLWATSVSRLEEYAIFDESDDKGWSSMQGDYWWVSKDAGGVVGEHGERVAFFPRCHNHPGPWHGYPVSAIDDRDYEIPEDLIERWEADDVIDDLVAGRMRRGKI